MIAIIDYDAGNLKSVEKALQKLGGDVQITRKREDILSADHVILPGVGAFGDAMEKLHSYHLTEVLYETAQRQIPLLGICLGLQLFFESSEESPGVKGLGLMKGTVRRIPQTSPDLKIPHMGWNSLHFETPGRLFEGIPDGSYAYFVHSYYLKAEDPAVVTASTYYGTTIHASVEQGNLFACQFHPEKSSDTGLSILRNFMQIH